MPEEEQEYEFVKVYPCSFGGGARIEYQVKGLDKAGRDGLEDDMTMWEDHEIINVVSQYLGAPLEVIQIFWE